MITRTRLQIIKYVDKKNGIGARLWKDVFIATSKRKYIGSGGRQPMTTPTNYCSLEAATSYFTCNERGNLQTWDIHLHSELWMNFLFHLSLPTCRSSFLRVCTPQRRTNIYIYTVPWGGGFIVDKPTITPALYIGVLHVKAKTYRTLINILNPTLERNTYVRKYHVFCAIYLI
jgi:hypothetical protein